MRVRAYADNLVVGPWVSPVRVVVDPTLRFNLDGPSRPDRNGRTNRQERRAQRRRWRRAGRR